MPCHVPASDGSAAQSYLAKHQCCVGAMYQDQGPRSRFPIVMSKRSEASITLFGSLLLSEIKVDERVVSYLLSSRETYSMLAVSHRQGKFGAC